MKKRAVQSIALLMILLLSESCSQKALNRLGSGKLEPNHIDTLTEDVLVVDKRVATLYFKKSDVKEYITLYDSLDSKRKPNFPYTLGLVKKTGSSKLVDWWYSYTEEERKKLLEKNGYNNQDEKYLNEFFFLAPALIRDGKFMIISKATGEEVRKGLKMKRVKGLYGGLSIQYRLPSGEQFWYEIISLGEQLRPITMRFYTWLRLTD